MTVAAPTLTLISDPTDNTPSFQGTGDILVGDQCTLRVWADEAQTTQVDSATLAATLAGIINLLDLVGPLADAAAYWYTLETDRSGDVSPRSAAETDIIDTTAPVISSPTFAFTSSTTAELGLTTTEGGGSWFVVVTQSPVAPSEEQLMDGLDENGDAPDFDGMDFVEAAGVLDFTGGATGLNDANIYYAYSMHIDTWGNRSNIVSVASSFYTYTFTRRDVHELR